eukprot:COSAG01_NODE_34963_length_539_cov_0.911364_1_plen_66_part_00
MKWDPESWRESCVLHYGKRGITVHGACLMYVKDSKMVRRYFDCVVAGDAKQGAVVHPAPTFGTVG